MKTFTLCFTLLLMATVMQAQIPYATYETSADPQHPEVKVFKGIINKYLIQNDGSFAWYTANQQAYTPDTATLSSFESIKAQNIQLVIFGGTWCEDTQFILPKLFKLQEQSGVPDANISFFGVDRSKKTLGNLSEAFGITNVPTVIVMKNGKELGRVIEYGKTGKWDKELAAIIHQP